MKRKLSIQQRLILPIVLLGIVALLSNALSVFSINNVNSNAAKIVDNHMAGAAKLAEIRRSFIQTHKLALSHIVAADYGTMITIVNQIKEEEKNLDSLLSEYKPYVTAEDESVYDTLLENYNAFKHSLVSLVCASADSKTQEAYAYANGDAADYGAAAEQNIEQLDASISAQTESARNILSSVYISSIIITGISSLSGILLVIAAVRIILKHVIRPIKNMIQTLHGSSEHINQVTGEVLEKTKTSNKNAKNLYTLIESLSAAIKKVAGSASAINRSVSDVNTDVNDIVKECQSIADYSSTMKMRAEEMEQTAQMNTETISAKAADILVVLEEAIQNSRSVDQVNSLAKDILSISTTTNLIALNASVEASRAGEAGRGFAVVASEIRSLADSCANTAASIHDVNKIVTDAVHNLSDNAQELVDYLNDTILAEFQLFVYAGKQYKDDASYIQEIMESFSAKAGSLKNSMTEITASIAHITNAIDEGAGGITGAAGSTRSLAGNMADITGRMDTNKEIVEELKQQTEVFSNL